MISSMNALTNDASRLPSLAPDLEANDLTEKTLFCDAVPE